MTTKPKKVETWMPILVDKYLGDTTHLTTEQHGAYLLLLLTCWKRDGKLPADDAQLATIARLPMAKWRAYGPTLMEFFDHVDGHLTQKRLSAELERAKHNVQQRSEAGKKSAAKRAAGNGKSTAVATGDATGGPTEDQRATQQNVKPIPIPSSPTSKKVSKALPSHPPGGGAEGRFPEFWKAWPKNERKQDRKACLAKWRLHGMDAIADAILADLQVKRSTKKWAGGFIEAPLVYLNNRRWEDGVTPDGQDASESVNWRSDRRGIEAMGVKLGLGKWDEDAFQHGRGELFQAYERRVLEAFEAEGMPA